MITQFTTKELYDELCKREEVGGIYVNEHEEYLLYASDMMERPLYKVVGPCILLVVRG